MKNWSSDRLLSITAIVVSLGTLFTIVFQTNLIRKQQYASVLPYVEIWPRITPTSFKLMIMNNGVGPAFVEDVRIHYNDSIYQGDPRAFTARVIRKQEDVAYYYSTLKKGRLLPAGEIIELIGIENDSTSALKLYRWFGTDTVQLEVEYKSVYEEKWSAKGIGEEPVKLE